jgi:hypothetical protein
MECNTQDSAASRDTRRTASNRKYRLNNRSKIAELNKAWGRTLPGKLSNTYTQMLMRVRGKNGARSVSYEGLPICTKQEFYEWSLKDSEFLRLYKEWRDANYPLAISPSIDRINPNFGYELWNMQWITQAENSRKGVIQHYYGPAAA